MLAAVIGVLLAAGCSGHYDRGLRDMALGDQSRLAHRVGEMVKTAHEAVEIAEAAARALAGAERSARGARLVNQAEAEAFEFSRQQLIVLDVLPEGGAGADRLRHSMELARQALDEVVESLRHAEAGAHLGADGLSGPLERVAGTVETLESDAAAVLTPAAAGTAGYSPTYRRR